MNLKQKSAYETGYMEAFNYGQLASLIDFCCYIGDQEDYESYLQGFYQGQSELFCEEE